MAHVNPPHPIIIADDVGSRELELPLLKLGAKTKLTPDLEFSDFAFSGNTDALPSGHEALIGIERKKIRDLADSIATGRIGHHQVGGMLDTFNTKYLLVEGAWKCGENGELMWLSGGKMVAATIGKRLLTFDEIAGFLLTISNIARFKIIPSTGPADTARWVVRAWRWHGMDWNEHTSLGEGGIGGGIVETAPLRYNPGLVWKWANQITGVGPKAASAIAAAWPKVEDLIENMYEAEKWAEVVIPGKKGTSGKKLGMTLGEKIVKQIMYG